MVDLVGRGPDGGNGGGIGGGGFGGRGEQVPISVYISYLELNDEHVLKHVSGSCACDGHECSVSGWGVQMAGDYLPVTGDYFSGAGDYLPVAGNQCRSVAEVERVEDEEELGGGGHAHK